MQYQRFNASSCGFPKPRVAVLPSLHLNALQIGRSFEIFTKSTRFYARGRYALAEAYRLCGVGPHSRLLAPAYHCRTMLDSAIHLGADVTLYPMTSDLRPDMGCLEDLLSDDHKPVAALLVTHYFGFAQDLSPLVRFCADHGIALIEDCSHCLPTLFSETGVGSIGRYSVWSPYKFMPSGDGGLLRANGEAALPTAPLRPQGLLSELKGMVRVAQRSQALSHVPHAETLDQEIRSATNAIRIIGHDTLEASAELSGEYDPAFMNTKGLYSSHWVIQHTNIARLRRLRRHNYLQWLRAVGALPKCRAFFPTLPDDCVPYMFPLWIDHPDVDFYTLKHLGIPVWRWDDMAVSNCALAAACRLHLIQLPCHQAVTPGQMAWMLAGVTKVLSQQGRH